jgi:hypothetical protein
MTLSIEQFQEPIEQITSNAVAIFSGGLDETLARISQELKNFTPDISTEKGRKQIKSQAFKAARCKTKLDDMGLQLTEDARAKITAINADRKKVNDYLDALRDEIRKPVDDWEESEKKRTDDHEAAILHMDFLAAIGPARAPQYIDDTMHELDDFWRGRDWEEFAMRAETSARAHFEDLKTALISAKKYEADQAELEKLRAAQLLRDAEDAARKQKERDDRIAAEAAETARKAAEEHAANIAAETAAAAQKLLDAQRAATEAAEAAAAKAIDDQRIAAEKAEQERERALRDRIDTAIRNFRNRINGARRNAQIRIDAASAEKRNQDRIAAEAAESDRKRQEDRDHKAKVNNEALQALASLECVLGEVPAKAIVIAIAEGKIPHISIKY